MKRPIKRSDFPNCCGGPVEIMEERKGIEYRLGKRKERKETDRRVFYRCAICKKELEPSEDNEG